MEKLAPLLQAVASLLWVVFAFVVVYVFKSQITTAVPAAMEGSLELFNKVRNRIIHDADATEDDALRALDSAMTMLRAPNALPTEVHIVDQTRLSLFSDQACTKPMMDAQALVLDVTLSSGVLRNKAIFPTTRTHVQKGKQVSWEWNMGKTWVRRDTETPDTKETKLVWGACAGFVGRHLDYI